jgi:hypothetical protein
LVPRILHYRKRGAAGIIENPRRIDEAQEP